MSRHAQGVPRNADVTSGVDSRRGCDKEFHGKCLLSDLALLSCSTLQCINYSRYLPGYVSVLCVLRLGFCNRDVKSDVSMHFLHLVLVRICCLWRKTFLEFSIW